MGLRPFAVDGDLSSGDGLVTGPLAAIAPRAERLLFVRLLLGSYGEKPQTHHKTRVFATGLRMAKEGFEKNPLLQKLNDLNRQAEAGGGPERQARQRSSGK